MSVPRIPKEIYISPGRSSNRSSREARRSYHSHHSEEPMEQSLQPQQQQQQPQQEKGRPYALQEANPEAWSARSRTNSEHTLTHRMSHSVRKKVGTVQRLAYVTCTIPISVFLSLCYTLVVLLPLGIAHLCSAHDTTASITNGYRRLFAVHARTMELESPHTPSTFLALSFGSLPVSLLISICGLFAACSQLYSVLLSEADSESTSLNRAMSLWLSWLCIFCDEVPEDKLESMV